MLPYVKYEKFRILVKKIEEMSKNVMDHSKCLEKCSWPYLHGAIEQINTNNSFTGIPLLNNTPEGRVTRKRTLDQFLEKQNLDTSSGIDLETKKLKKLVEAISQKLNSEVFGEDQKKIMTTLRQLCDIKELKRQIDKSNVPLIYVYYNCR